MNDVTLYSRLAGIVGGRTATELEKAFEMRTVEDLLWHFPRRYSNRGELTPLIGLPIGEHVTVLAQVLDVRERRMQRRGGSLLEARITDGHGSLKLTFFNQSWRARDLRPGVRGIFAGKVSEYRGQLQLQHPDYELFDEDSAPDSVLEVGITIDAEVSREPAGEDASENSRKNTGESTSLSISREQAMQFDTAAALAFAERPLPIYSATSKLASWTIQRAVELVLNALEEVQDPLSDELRTRAKIVNLATALELIHRPERTADWQLARDSMRFREAFDLQLALLDRRRRRGLQSTTRRPAKAGGLRDYFDASLTFDLTNDQRSAGSTIETELALPHPMHRLLQGEVGSGKTIVALRAMLQVAEGDGQSALLAPTEVLAAQHFRSIIDTLGPQLAERLNPVLLTSKMPVAEKRRALLSLASGSSRIAIGTHALLSDNVTFYDLGLVVVDEQHRFGVEQREALRRKGEEPHVLAMTATPIPRTVALTAFGDLEISTIRELPPGRQGIETYTVVPHERPKWAARVWLRIVEEVAQGRQAYVTCPAISEGKLEEGETEEPAETADASAKRPPISVEETLRELRARPDFAEIRVEALTGAMTPEAKDAVMRAFAAGEIDVLVATTVIEVGVNVPNASMMIVRDADRFGISQLHQLRGRVGRGEHPGLCLLMTDAEQGTVARERIEAVAATTDGFELAEKDLELRREGDILGTAQSGGRSTLKLLRVAEHGELIAHARELAQGLLERDPELQQAAGLRERLAADRLRFENLAKS